MNNLKINWILFFVLSLGILIATTTFFSPQKETQQQRTERTAETSLASPAAALPALPDISQAPASPIGAIVPTGKQITISTPLYTGTVDTLGGRMKEWLLTDFRATTSIDSPLVDILKDKIDFNNTVLMLEGMTVPNPIPFTYSGPTEIEVTDGGTMLRLDWVSPAGISVAKHYTFDPDNYVVKQVIEITNGTGNKIAERVLAESTANMVIEGKSEYNVKFVAVEDGDFKKVDSKPDEIKDYEGIIDWFGFSEKYFMAAFLPDVGASTKVRLTPSDLDLNARATYVFPTSIVPAGATVTKVSELYLGPIEYEPLRLIGSGLDKVMDFGWIGFLARPTLWLLNLFNEWLHNYGLAIIAVTLLIRIVFLPLTVKSMQSMKTMQNKMHALKPKIDAMKEKYKDDKVKQNQELMQLYSSHGVNPLSSLGGCLPMLVQVPVFIALYEVLLYAIELRHSSFLWIDNLAEPEHLFDLPLIGVPFRLLPLIMGVSWYLSQKLTPTTTPGTENNIQMKMMQYMPIIFTVMFWGLPSGLILYWTVSNILAIVQQLYVNRTMVKKGRA